MPRVLKAMAIVIAMLAGVGAAPAQAQFAVESFDGETTADSSGTAYTQAGGHPYEASTIFKVTSKFDAAGFLRAPLEDPKTVSVTLPPGLVGNPEAAPLCEPVDFFTGGTSRVQCAPQTQVGIVVVYTVEDPSPGDWRPLYSLRPSSDDVPVAFGFELSGQRIVLNATVGPAPDYLTTVTAPAVIQGVPIIGSEVRIWGTPASPAHDGWRCMGPGPSGCTGPPGTVAAPVSVAGGVPERPFISLPTSCTAPGEGVVTSIELDSWQSPGVFHSKSFLSHLPPGFPLPVDQWGAVQGPEGCERLPFDPSVSVQPVSRGVDESSGLKVRIAVEQGAGHLAPKALSAAHLRRASVTLPEGMSINPSAADGLDACSDEQFGAFDTQPSRCPEASKVGTVRGITPVLEDELVGDVYVGSQRSDDPMSGEMFRLLMVLRGRGIVVKLTGAVQADPRTGRLEATFDENPQYPVSLVEVDMKGGDRAPLALPTECGTHTTQVELSSWAGHVRNLSDSFKIPCPAGGGFDPVFEAGSVSPAGGQFSPFVARIGRPQGQRFLSGIEVGLPKGLVAKLAGIELCPDAVASDGTPGTCPAGSRIGTATVASGSGSPFRLSGGVFLTGRYNGGPYGLSVQVPAKAGPFDLGMVKVRQAIHVDPETAEVSIVSDPLPRVVKGVPVRLRDIDVAVDRPGFMINPTSCAEKQINAKLTAVDGQARDLASRFQAADCRALSFRPRMAMRLLGRGQTRTGAHPALRTVVSQAGGQSNIGRAQVTLPKSVALDAVNSADPALLCDYDASLKADCPASSVIGRAVANTPVLDRRLAGDVHLVQGIKFGPKGNRIRTTPSLLVKLRGQVAINLRATTTTQRGTNRLVTTFTSVPDAPVSKFTLKVNGGRKGILVVTRTARRKINLCSGRQVASVETTGHNGRRQDFATTVKTPCASSSHAKKAKRAGASKPAARKRG